MTVIAARRAAAMATKEAKMVFHFHDEAKKNFYQMDAEDELYPTLILRHRYSHIWFAIGRANDPSGIDGLTRFEWMLSEEYSPNGPNGAFALFPNIETPPEWLTIGDDPGAAYRKLCEKLLPDTHGPDVKVGEA